MGSNVAFLEISILKSSCGNGTPHKIMSEVKIKNKDAFGELFLQKFD